MNDLRGHDISCRDVEELRRHCRGLLREHVLEVRIPIGAWPQEESGCHVRHGFARVQVQLWEWKGWNESSWLRGSERQQTCEVELDRGIE